DELGVGHDQADSLGRHTQLLGHDLRKRSANILSDLHLPGVSSHRTIFADMKPGADILRWWCSTAALPSLRRPLCQCDILEKNGNDNPAAEDLRELTPAEIPERRSLVEFIALGLREEVIERPFAHLPPPFVVLAACSMADMIRP